MAQFRVIEIIDGDTFEVSPQWRWNENSGSRVRPTGYDAPELNVLGGQVAKNKLAKLILGKLVELGKAYKVDRGRLICDVLFQGVPLARYFPEY